MNNIFTSIGIVTVIGLGITVLSFAAACIIDQIHEAVWAYKYRHRFDKPPTAACYCIDCKFHGDDTDPSRCTRCTNIIVQTAYEWFCSFAEPKERNK